MLKYPLLLRELVSLTDHESEEHYHLTGEHPGHTGGPLVPFPKHFSVVRWLTVDVLLIVRERLRTWPPLWMGEIRGENDLSEVTPSPCVGWGDGSIFIFIRREFKLSDSK